MGQVSTNLFSKSFTYSQAKNYRSILVVLGQAFANNCRWHLDPYWAHTAESVGNFGASRRAELSRGKNQSIYVGQDANK